jgi:hypothetical protein
MLFDAGAKAVDARRVRVMCDDEVRRALELEAVADKREQSAFLGGVDGQLVGGASRTEHEKSGQAKERAQGASRCKTTNMRFEIRDLR